jgi:hypothetical protein
MIVAGLSKRGAVELLASSRTIAEASASAGYARYRALNHRLRSFGLRRIVHGDVVIVTDSKAALIVRRA